MKLKLAKRELKGKTKTIEISEIENELQDATERIFYFDKDNAHKDLVSLVDAFEQKGYRVYLREIKFGLDENDYLYEVHILQ